MCLPFFGNVIAQQLNVEKCADWWKMLKKDSKKETILFVSLAGVANEVREARWAVDRSVYTYANFYLDFKDNVFDFSDRFEISSIELVKGQENDLLLGSFEKELRLKVLLVDKHDEELQSERVVKMQGKHRPVGLINENNNCFGNAVLQCLAITKPFVSSLFGQKFGEECSGNCHTCDLRRDLKKIRKAGAAVFFPTIFKHIQSFGGDFEDGLGHHHDSYEFLRILLQKLSHGTHGCLTDMFGGKFRRSKMCSKCGVLSYSEEDFTELVLNIPHREQDVAATLADCLNFFVEEVVPDSLSHCECCMNDQKTIRKCTLHETRDVIAIVLQRFEPDKFGGYQKMGKEIKFPMELDISPYMSGVAADKHVYELFGIIVHEGGVEGGHYKSFVKTDFWYEVSDRHVTRVKEKIVLRAQAYILFYNRKEEANSFDEDLAFAASAMSSSDHAVPTSTSEDYTEITLSPEVSSAAMSYRINAVRFLELKSYSDQDMQEKYIISMDRDSSDVSERIRNAMLNCNESRQEYHFDLPATDGPFYDNNLEQYCLRRGARFRTISTISNVEAKRVRAVRMHFLLCEILKLLQQKKVLDVGAIGYREKSKFGNYSRSALLRRIDDVCMLLGTTRLSLNISVMSRGYIIGPVLFKVGEDVLVDASLRAVQIPHDIHLVDHIDLKKPVSFVLIVEKLSIFNMLVLLNFHVTHNCIIITGRGNPDMATRAAVFKLSHCLPVKVYILVDLDLHGLQLYYTYKLGSKVRAFENLCLASRDLKWLGALPKDSRLLEEPKQFTAEEQSSLTTLMKSLPTSLDRDHLTSVLDWNKTLNLHEILDYENIVEYLTERMAELEEQQNLGDLTIN